MQRQVAAIVFVSIVIIIVIPFIIAFSVAIADALLLIVDCLCLCHCRAAVALPTAVLPLMTPRSLQNCQAGRRLVFFKCDALCVCVRGYV
jgi:hypothetical protein